MQDSPLTLSRRRKFTIYFAALAAMFMAVLDMHIVATALPTIADDLGNLELFGWVGAAYMLANAVTTPFYGKLGDLFGRKNVFLFSIALFTLGSLACGLAWSMESLIAARVLQGLGGGGLMTLCFVIIADLFEPRERAKYQGYSSAVFTLAGLSGPVAGGLIAQSIGWEFIFLINLPLGIAVIAVMLFVLPSTKSDRQPKIDYWGGLLLAATIVLCVFWAEEVLGADGSVQMAIILPLLAILSGTAFVLVERRAVEPVLPLHFFNNSTIRLALIISLIVGVATLGMLNYFALFLQTVTGLPPATAGLLFVPGTFGSLVASVGAGILVSRTGRYKMFPVLSMLVGFTVLILFAQVNAATPLWAIAMLMFSFSFSIGLQMQTLLVAVQNAAPVRDMGAVTGSIGLARLMGASLGLAANGGLLTAGLVRGQDQLPPQVAAQLPAEIKDMTPAIINELPAELAAQTVDIFANSIHILFYFGASLFAINLVLALMLKDVRLPARSDETSGAKPAKAQA